MPEQVNPANQTTPVTTTPQTKAPLNWKLIGIIAVIAAVVIGGLGYGAVVLGLFGKSEPIQTNTTTQNTKTTTTSANPNTETSDWQTIKAEISKWQANGSYKFEFKAPKEFETTKPSKDDEKYYFGASGSNINFFAGLMEGPGPLTVLYGRAAKNPLCSKPLEIQEIYTNYFEVCDTLSLDNQKVLFLINLHLGGKTDTDPTCTSYANVYIAYNFENTSTSLYFQPSLTILKEITKPWEKYVKTTPSYDKDGAPIGCPDNADSSKVKESLQASIKNIRNRQGLSEQDNQTLQTLYKILPTFKFL